MTNKEIYQKTLTFSLRRFIIDLLAFLLLGGFATAGFFLMNKVNDQGLVGLLIGLFIGLFVIGLILKFVGFRYKAGQIAMMTKGVTENALPDDVYAEGKRIVKERFTSVLAFFAVTGAIRALFNQIGRGISNVGEKLGGDTGSGIASAVNSGVQTVIGYLCDCCLGWVFFRKEQKTTKAALEGAAIFFKHGKTLLKNVGRIFGMTLLTFILIGGAFFGIFFGIFSMLPAAFSRLTEEMVEMSVRFEFELPAALQDPKTVVIVAAAIAALIIFGIVHSVFVRPFILVGVLRNYMESGKNDIPSEEAVKEIGGRSSRFQKLLVGDL